MKPSQAEIVSRKVTDQDRKAVSDFVKSQPELLVNYGKTEHIEVAVTEQFKNCGLSEKQLKGIIFEDYCEYFK
jgi:hypothetical protein